jgi:hypothetical protein
MEFFSSILVLSMGLRGYQQEGDFHTQQTSINVDITHSQTVQSRSSIDLVIFESVHTQLHKQILMEVPIIEQSIPTVVDNIQGYLNLRSKGSGDYLRHKESNTLHSLSLLEIDELPICVWSELLQPEAVVDCTCWLN